MAIGELDAVVGREGVKLWFAQREVLFRVVGFTPRPYGAAEGMSGERGARARLRSFASATLYMPGAACKELSRKARFAGCVSSDCLERVCSADLQRNSTPSHL